MWKGVADKKTTKPTVCGLTTCTPCEE